MKSLKKVLLVGASAFTLAIVINFLPSISQAQLPDDHRAFNNCWGSGNFNMSCSDGATVIGCQPEQESVCVGKKNVEEVPGDN